MISWVKMLTFLTWHPSLRRATCILRFNFYYRFLLNTMFLARFYWQLIFISVPPFLSYLFDNDWIVGIPYLINYLWRCMAFRLPAQGFDPNFIILLLLYSILIYSTLRCPRWFVLCLYADPLALSQSPPGTCRQFSITWRVCLLILHSMTL